MSDKNDQGKKSAQPETKTKQSSGEATAKKGRKTGSARMKKPDTVKGHSYSFQAEIRQLLDILTHSLYTHRDIFIRELISNAVDALDKARFKSIKGEKIAETNLDFEIGITLDRDKKIFMISDTGIGMTRDELIGNIGTIARSGTSDFLKHLSKEQKQDINLIGRFGVGFYSVFMAAERVEIITKSANPDEHAYSWTSDGRGEFEIRQIDGDISRGTTVKVFLRQDAEEFSEKFHVQSIIEKYSNFVPFPIKVDKEQVNKVTAIWREPKSSVTHDQYIEFYKFIAKQNENPLTWMHLSADVPLQFHSLLFVPRTNMELLGFNRENDGIHLFVKRVMVDSHAEDILPHYLRFVRGVLESDDLPLNISRETLQDNPYLFKIKNAVVGKLLAHLSEFAEKEPDKYKELWRQHGRILKEGYNDYTNKEKIAELFRFNSSKCGDGDELISLSTYAERMQDKQENIYYLSGPDRDSLHNNPNTEIFKANDLEVLYCYDPIDEFALPGLLEYKGQKIVSVDQVDMSELAKITSVKSETDKKKKTEYDKKEMDNLARRIKDILGTKIEDVRISERLVDSPAVLVNINKGMSAQMEKLMHLYDKDSPLSAKNMEINPNHPMIADLLTIYHQNVKDPLLTKVVHNLYHSVVLLDGMIVDPHEMASGIQDVLQEMTAIYIRQKQSE